VPTPGAPPRLIRWCAARVLAERDREFLLADLDEEYSARRTRSGRAAVWYLAQAVHAGWTRRDLRVLGVPPRVRIVDALRTEWDQTVTELRLAIRRLVKRPGASTASVLTLACSIGAATATWSLLSATIVQPLRLSEPDRLMVVGVQEASGPRATRPPRTSLMSSEVQAIRASGAFADVVAYGIRRASIATRGDEHERPVAFPTWNFFRLLGVPVAIGRDFSPDDDRRDAAPVAILSHAFWGSVLNADPAIVGQTIEIDRRTVRIIGVAARDFPGLDLASPPDVYLPIGIVIDATGTQMSIFAATSPRVPLTAWVTVVGRPQPDHPLAAVADQLTVALSNVRRRASLIPIEIAALPEASRPAMTEFARLLSMTVGLLLLVGCLTVGMLLLIRTEARRDEFAMCLALGASRGRLARGVAIEGALLSAAGAVLALPAAAWFVGALGTLPLPGGIRIDTLDLSIDRHALIAASAGAVAATLVVAIVAGVFGFSTSIADALRSRAGATPRLVRRRTRAGLIAGQVAVTLVLISGAGLFARSLAASLHVNPGFEATHLITGRVTLGAFQFTPEQAPSYFANLRDRLTHNAAIRSVSMPATAVSMGPSGALQIDGIERHFPSELPEIPVDERYFSTIGLAILAGRDFASTDDSRAPLVTIVSESFGRMIANGASPLGSRITAFHGQVGKPMPVLSIVGVVPDVIMDVARLQPLAMYVPVAQEDGPPVWNRELFARPASDVATAEREIATAVRQLDPTLKPKPTVTVLTMDEQIGQQMGPQRFGAVVLGALGGIALLLTLLGTYVLAESMAAARTREMGVRAALGARGHQLGGLVLAESSRLVGLGLVVGLLLAWAEASTVRALLFRVEPFDPVTLLGTAALIFGLALFVSLRPAIRAARVDLADVLREE
jgi:putative ABC transport system permease protein